MHEPDGGRNILNADLASRLANPGFLHPLAKIIIRPAEPDAQRARDARFRPGAVRAVVIAPVALANTQRGAGIITAEHRRQREQQPA